MGVGVCVAIFIGIALSWGGQSNSAPKEQQETTPIGKDEKIKKAFQELADTIKADKPTEAERKNLFDIHRALKTEDGTEILSYSYVGHLRPLLEAEKNTTADVVEVGVQQNGKELVASLFGKKLNKKINVNLSSNSMTLVGRNPSEGLKLKQDYGTERSRKAYVGVSFGTNPKNRKDKVLAISMGQKDLKYIPYDHSAHLLRPPYSHYPYRIAVAPRISKKEGRFDAIMIIDLERLELVAEVELPKSSGTPRPYFTIDDKRNVVVSVAYDLSWFLAIDLNPYMKGLKN